MSELALKEALNNQLREALTAANQRAEALQAKVDAMELDVETLRELANTGQDCIALKARVDAAEKLIEEWREAALNCSDTPDHVIKWAVLSGCADELASAISP